MNHVTLKKIDESNFIDCFNLKLAMGQEEYVSHPIRSLAQAYAYYRQCVPFGIYEEDKMVGYVMVINEVAYRLYRQIGFVVETGRNDDDESELGMTL